MWVLLMHGGALSRIPAGENSAVWKDFLSDYLVRAGEMMADGQSALDAVTEAVAAMEDSALFNAGYGAVPTDKGTHELDAAIMDGATRSAGSVAVVTRLAYPIRAARLVMEQTPHVLLAGPEADARLLALGANMRDANHRQMEVEVAAIEAHGTVGAVALDIHGQLASATSTGGLNHQWAGRVGDSPLIGAGCYADAQVAVSTTGKGETFMRTVAAHQLAMRVAYAAEPLEQAADSVLRDVGLLGGSGGLIAVNKAGDIAMPFISAGMIRAVVGSNQPLSVAV